MLSRTRRDGVEMEVMRLPRYASSACMYDSLPALFDGFTAVTKFAATDAAAVKAAALGPKEETLT
jgi:hypothetical protein